MYFFWILIDMCYVLRTWNQTEYIEFFLKIFVNVVIDPDLSKQVIPKVIGIFNNYAQCNDTTK